MSGAEKLYQAIGDLPPDMVEAAQDTPLHAPHSKPHWGRWMAAAACLCVAVGVGWSVTHLRMGNSGAGSGGSGHDEGSVFLSYAGPVLPLTLAEDTAVTAERSITMDFAGGEGQAMAGTSASRATAMQVTDSYVLSNPTEKALTVTAVYPFVGNLQDLAAQQPTVLVDGGETETALSAGGFASGDDWKQPGSWEDYQALLADGSYQAEALSPSPALKDSVTVYEFTDSQAPEDADAATLAIRFTVDPDRTEVLTWGIHGCSWNSETGERQYSYFVERKALYQERHLLIVRGDDIGDYDVRGYEDGGCEQELEGVTATLTRRETTLGAVLAELVENYRAQSAVTYGEDILADVPEDLLMDAVTDMVRRYAATARYDIGQLDEAVADAVAVDRVFYLTFPVTIPAGGSVTVTASFQKDASFDYSCAHTENRGVCGYDLMTQLGSNLRFTGQQASIVHGDRVELVRQNFGFDVDGGVTTVALDPEEAHYYLEVRWLPSED
jgi:hypothetical protein